jgi:hypothetical protein
MQGEIYQYHFTSDEEHALITIKVAADDWAKWRISYGWDMPQVGLEVWLTNRWPGTQAERLLAQEFPNAQPSDPSMARDLRGREARQSIRVHTPGGIRDRESLNREQSPEGMRDLFTGESWPAGGSSE